MSLYFSQKPVYYVYSSLRCVVDVKRKAAGQVFCADSGVGTQMHLLDKSTGFDCDVSTNTQNLKTVN